MTIQIFTDGNGRKYISNEPKLDQGSEDAMAKRKWVNLTDDEIKEIIGSWGDTPVKGYTRKLMDQIQDKLKEKNG